MAGAALVGAGTAGLEAGVVVTTAAALLVLVDRVVGRASAVELMARIELEGKNWPGLALGVDGVLTEGCSTGADEFPPDEAPPAQTSGPTW